MSGKANGDLTINQILTKLDGLEDGMNDMIARKNHIIAGLHEQLDRVTNRHNDAEATIKRLRAQIVNLMDKETVVVSPLIWDHDKLDSVLYGLSGLRAHCGMFDEHCDLRAEDRFDAEKRMTFRQLDESMKRAVKQFGAKVEDLKTTRGDFYVASEEFQEAMRKSSEIFVNALEEAEQRRRC